MELVHAEVTLELPLHQIQVDGTDPQSIVEQPLHGLILQGALCLKMAPFFDTPNTFSFLPAGAELWVTGCSLPGSLECW